jgi:hypothetical protein
VHRYVTAEGYARNEGDIQVGSKPYPISYRSIRPKADECSNLLVPVCMSASHIAYGSIRMEPVFMVLGQSAASAAVLAIDGGCSVQEVNYGTLKAQLLKDMQVLDFIPVAGAGKVGVTKAQLGGIVVDDVDAVATGFEAVGNTSLPFVEQGYRHDGGVGDGSQRIRFVPVLPKDGLYKVSLAYSALGNRASNVPVTIKHAGGEAKMLVNEQKKAPGGLLLLGEYEFKAGKVGWVELCNEATDGHVIADAVQWLAVE